MTIILLHAFPLDSRMWKQQADALSDEFEIIAPDLRGFGEAHAQLGGALELSIDAAAEEVIEMLDQRGIEKAVIGGISRGGYIALRCARRDPDRLGALMLFDTRATPADAEEKRWYAQMLSRLDEEGMRCLPETMKARLFGPLALNKKPDLIRQVSEMIESQQIDAVRAAAIGMVNRPDARPDLCNIRVPVLAVAGTEDGAFESTCAIANAVPMGEFIAVENSGHLSNMEEPLFVAKTIRHFLHRVIE